MQSSTEVFKVLSSEQRLKMIRHLLEADEFKCYCELDDVLKKDLSVIYRHFKKLEDAGILETRKKEKRLEGRVREPEKIEKLWKIVEEINNED